MTGRRYREGAGGFVVEWEHTMTSAKTGDPYTTFAYWHGPDRIIPTSWGPLEHGTAVFASRPAASRAFDSIYGADAIARNNGRRDSRYRVRRVADLETAVA